MARDIPDRPRGTTARRTLLWVLPLLLLPAGSLLAQGLETGWRLQLSGTLTAFGLDLRDEPDWRRALSGRVRVVAGNHLHFEATATSPSSSDHEILDCPDVGLGSCTSTVQKKPFSVLTGGVGWQSGVGRFTPFLGLGGGMIKVQDRREPIWLLYSGSEIRLLEALHLLLDYRVSRVAWGAGGVGVNQEWSLGVAVDLLPMHR